MGCQGDPGVRKASTIVFSLHYGCIATVTGWNRNYYYRNKSEKETSLVFEYRPMHYPTLLYNKRWHVDKEYSGYVSMNSFIPLIAGMYVYDWNYKILSNQVHFSTQKTLLTLVDLLYKFRDRQTKKISTLEKQNKKFKHKIEVKIYNIYRSSLNQT